MKFAELQNRIEAPDRHAMAAAKARLDGLTKPLGSLGTLEEIVQRLAGIFQTPDFVIDKKAVIVMCADNGVCEEGVSSCPKAVTASVTRNFTKGITGINVFCKLTGADLVVVDVGVDADLSDTAGILHKKICYGTNNIAKVPAMEREETIRAIETGLDVVEDLAQKGYRLLATGEMGIGNTTTSSAVSAVLLGLSPEELVGRGAGLSDQAYRHKIQVVKEAIALHTPDSNDPLDVLQKVGGLDLAALTGCFLGAAALRMPILIDGFISATAALAAVCIEAKVRHYLFPSHASAEPGANKILQRLALQPMLNLHMRLGEGTGAALAFHVFEAACAAYTQMGTFEDAKIRRYVPQA